MLLIRTPSRSCLKIQRLTRSTRIKNKKQSLRKNCRLHLIKVLRANKYDLIVNLTDQWMVAILVRLLNARVKKFPGLSSSAVCFLA
ncbi:glycosyltransferase family 9 protein [Escherichia coli]